MLLTHQRQSVTRIAECTADNSITAWSPFAHWLCIMGCDVVNEGVHPFFLQTSMLSYVCNINVFLLRICHVVIDSLLTSKENVLLLCKYGQYGNHPALSSTHHQHVTFINRSNTKKEKQHSQRIISLN